MTHCITVRCRVRATSSWGALGLLLAFGAGTAAADPLQSTPATTPTTSPDTPAPVAQTEAGQETPTPPLATGASERIADPTEIVVTGARASQQSANNRKRDARTATDSIVADDIGSFPDRNVNEAISRIPGVALGRNEFGEGSSVAVRGNGPNLTRVELDGIGVQSTGTGTGRGADLRELPAELVKSVDVVKGSTADQTEGSIGGGVQIKTRSGLDFKEPYFSVRGGAQQNSLSQQWTPDFNAVAARKFFDGRLGVIASGTYTKVQNSSSNYENTTSGGNMYNRFFDFDNSPEKTFAFNPATVGTDLANVPINANTLETPFSLVTKSANARSKAECLTIFPDNPTGNAPGLPAATQAAQRAQRILEQRTCLNQWNDYTPSLIRNFMNEQNEERYSFDARVDYQLTDELVVFAKGTIANRKVRDQFRTRNQVSLPGLAPANGTFLDTTTGYPRIRSVSPTAPPGYFLFDPQFFTSNVGNNAVRGAVTNVVPGSIEIDEGHNVTKFTLTNNSVNIDQIENIIDIGTKYAQAGAEYRGERLEIDAFVGITTATSSRGDLRTNRSYAYGDATLTLQPNGLYDIEVPASYDDTNPANYVQLRLPNCIQTAGFPNTGPGCLGQAAAPLSATNTRETPNYTLSQLPLVTPNFAVSYNPQLRESEEQIAKLDLAYRTDEILPFISRIKVGAMYRKNSIDSWGNGGYTAKSATGTFGAPGYVPAVVVPTNNLRGSVRACEESASSSVAAGGAGCQYGFVPNSNPANVRYGVDTLTPDQLRDLFARTLDEPDGQYFAGLPNRGNLPDAWQGIRTDKFFAALGQAEFQNFDCLIECTGSDGQVYDQPVARARETIKNVYAMLDFEQRLPLGLLFNGNVGVRGVFRTVNGTGLQTLNSIRTTPLYDPNNRDAPAGIRTISASQNVTLNAKTTDWLPSVNLNLWAFNEKVVLRAYGGKTIAQPTVGNLLPAGNCTIDQRIELDAGGDVFGCGGRVGNPALKPFTAYSYNLSLEWYPNADTLFAVAYGKLDVKIGNPRQVTITGARPFAGSDLVDPETGTPLADLEFNLPTFDNGPGYKRDIWEFTAKTAFTFLPSFLQYTGADANLSMLSSSVTTGVADPITGEVQPPPDESKYYLNASIWYDDGKLNLRASYQWRTSIFTCITPQCGGGGISDTNYPGEGYANVALPYNPGVPRYTDSTTFIDAKASYNISENFQVYLEGRNLLKESQTISAGDYVRFPDGSPRILRLQYGGRRILAGARLKFGGG